MKIMLELEKEEEEQNSSNTSLNKLISLGNASTPTSSANHQESNNKNKI